MAKRCMELISPDIGSINSVLYCVGLNAREYEKTENDKLLSMDLTNLAYSEWDSPIVFAPKKNGSLPFFVDYINYITITVKDAESIPRMDECPI